MNNRKEYRKTKEGHLVFKYDDMRKRSLNPDKSNINGDHLCIRDEFYNWALNNPEFNRLFKLWKKSEYKYSLTPSIDRIDNNIGYSLDNIQFLTVSDNSKKANKYNENGHFKKIRLEKDGEILDFNSIKEVMLFLDISKSSLYYCRRYHNKVKGYEIIHLLDKDKIKIELKSNGYHLKKVEVCKDNVNLKFNSVKEAANYLNVAGTNISFAARNNKKVRDFEIRYI